MLFSGFKKRSIADQTGIVDFRFSLSFSNTTGECVVGLSGTRNFLFTFKSGKVYDNVGNFVHSYAPVVPVSISGQVGQTSYDYTINDDLVALGNPISSGRSSWLFINPTNTTVDFDGFVRGAIPNYYADTAGKYLYENHVVTGRVINLNSGQRFRIFDVEVLQASSPYSVVDFTTGNISRTGYIRLTSDQIGLSDYTVPLLLRTNFGDVPLDFVVTGDYSVIPDVYLNISPDTTNVINGVAKNYTTQFAYYPTGAYLGVSLEYVDGITGKIYFFEDHISDIQYRLLSGTIVGCDRLYRQDTGVISGYDALDLSYSYGTGTGDFYSNQICPTGTFSQNYELDLFGLGNGLLQTNYTASGHGVGMFSGRVPFSGGYLTIVGYNFVGTGDSPGVAVGVVPTGTGRYFAHPTGCWAVSQNLTYGTDYYSGTLSFGKAYEGPLSVPYSTVSVGWATGDFVQGVVDSTFVLNFDQGNYTFTKYFSGLVYGYMQNTGNFLPTGCIDDQTPVSGIVTGTYSITRLLECSSTTGLPMIPVTGYPIFVYDSQRRIVLPNTVVLVRPSGGFLDTETSYDALAGTYTRTKTSRMGATPSGNGYFSQPIGGCDDFSLTGKIWKESMPLSGATGTFDSSDNSIGYVSTRMYLNDTGDMADLSNLADSGAMHFYISGAGKKAVALRGLNLGNTARILQLTLLKDGVYYDSWENVSMDYALNSYHSEAAENTTSEDTIGLSELESGYYSLYVTAKEAAYPTVSFSSSIFSGCESSRNLLVTVMASGIFRSPVCVDMMDYEELTAHSGVNYDPIYLKWNDEGVRNNGCKYIAAASNAQLCPGICFDVGSPDEYGMLPDEVRYYSFTLPIYDNAGYGGDHEFYVSLSNPSGATIVAPAEALIRIVENDNPGLVTGGRQGDVFLKDDDGNEYQRLVVGDYNGVFDATGLEIMTVNGMLTGFGIMNNTSFECEFIEPRNPEPPDPCIFLPELCNYCLQNPAACEPYDPQPPDCSGCPPQACCACPDTMYITGACPGYGSRIFGGLVGTPGSTCGQVSAMGCGPTTGYMFVGQICCSGTTIAPVFSGHCLTSTFVAYSSTCGEMDDNQCGSGICRSDVSWSGCSDGSGCSGNSGILANFEGCLDYAKKPRGGKRPTGPKCESLLVFLKVSEIPNCDSSASTCAPWKWTGTCKFRPGNPMSQICPPPP